jgi:hypothetical protein
MHTVQPLLNYLTLSSHLNARLERILAHSPLNLTHNPNRNQSSYTVHTIVPVFPVDPPPGEVQLSTQSSASDDRDRRRRGGVVVQGKGKRHKSVVYVALCSCRVCVAFALRLHNVRVLSAIRSLFDSTEITQQ